MTSRFKTITFVLLILYFLANGLISCSRTRLLHKGYEDSKMTYTDKGRKKLAKYLRKWDKEKVENNPNDSLKTIYDIYRAFYNPYNFEPYYNRPPHNHEWKATQGYIVIQEKLKYIFLETNSLDSIQNCNRDDLYTDKLNYYTSPSLDIIEKFQPKLDFDSVLYLDSVRKRELVDFVFKKYEPNSSTGLSEKRLEYLMQGGLQYFRPQKEVYSPGAYRSYFESAPFVELILADTRANKAIVYYRISPNSLGRTYLERENNTWVIKQNCFNF